MYTSPELEFFRTPSIYRMDYRDLNPSICVVFSFGSLEDFRQFREKVSEIQKETLDCLDDELEGHFITFNNFKRVRSNSEKSDFDEDSSSNESTEENQIREFNLEKFYLDPVGDSESIEKVGSAHKEKCKINEFEVFESRETNEIGESLSKMSKKAQQKKRVKKLLRKNSSFSQKSWTEIKRFPHSREASEKRRLEPENCTANLCVLTETPGLFNFGTEGRKEPAREQKLIQVPNKIYEKNEFVETPESSSQADNSITEVDSIKNICGAKMSTHNSQVNFKMEENNSSELSSMKQRERVSSSGQFEKIGRDSENSGIFSTYSNNTESFRKNSESNGVESLEEFKVRKNSQHSGLDGDSFIIEDNWIQLGTMKSSGNQNAAHSNLDFENALAQPKRMTHDFSKRNLAEKKRNLEEQMVPNPKYNFHSSKNSLNRHLMTKNLELISKNHLSDSRRYSSNNELRLEEKNGGYSTLGGKNLICKVDSSEFFLPSCVETDSAQTLGQVCDTNKGSPEPPEPATQQLDSLNKIMFVHSNKCQHMWQVGDGEDSGEFGLKNLSELETPPASAERKKELKKSLEIVRA